MKIPEKGVLIDYIIFLKRKELNMGLVDLLLLRIAIPGDTPLHICIATLGVDLWQFWRSSPGLLAILIRTTALTVSNGLQNYCSSVVSAEEASNVPEDANEEGTGVELIGL